MACAGRHPHGVLDRGDPGGFVVPAGLAGPEGAGAPHAEASRAPFFAGFRADRPGDAAAARGRLPVHAGALLGGLPDPARDRRRPVAKPGRRWCWCCSTSPYVALAYPAGALSDRMSPKAILLAGMAVLVAADLILASRHRPGRPRRRRRPVGRAHGVDPRHFRAADRRQRAATELRATSFGAFYFVSGIATLLASLGAGLLWDREGAPGDVPHRRGAAVCRRVGDGDAR